MNPTDACPRTLSRWLKRRVPIVLFAFAAPPPAGAQDYAADRPPPASEVAIPLTAEEKALLAAVDARIAGVEGLVTRIDEPAYRASTIAEVESLKKRRAALGRKFDPGLYEALMHSVISRYQIVALWLKPPPLPARPNQRAVTPGRPAAAGKAATKPAAP